MKVLQVHAGYRFAAGEDTVVANEATALRTGGHEVEQFIVPNPTSAVASVAALGAQRAQSLDRPTVRTGRRRVPARCRPRAQHLVRDLVGPVQVAACTVDPGRDDAAQLPARLSQHRSVPRRRHLHRMRRSIARSAASCTGAIADSRALSAVQATEVMVTRRRRVLLDGVARFVAPSAFMGRAAHRHRRSGRSAGGEAALHQRSRDHAPDRRPRRTRCCSSVAWRRAKAPRASCTPGPDRAASGDLELVVLGDGPLLDGAAYRAPPSVRFDGWQSHDDVVSPPARRPMSGLSVRMVRAVRDGPDRGAERRAADRDVERLRRGRHRRVDRAPHLPEPRSRGHGRHARPARSTTR